MMVPQRRITRAYFEFALRKYTPAIYRVASKVGTGVLDIEELVTQGQIELLKCMACYDGSGKFLTFLHWRLYGTFTHMRDAEIRARRIHGVSGDCLVDCSSKPCDSDINLMVEDCLGCLDPSEREVVMALFFGGQTIREVSDDRQVALSTIFNIKQKALTKMRHRCKV